MVRPSPGQRCPLRGSPPALRDQFVTPDRVLEEPLRPEDVGVAPQFFVVVLTEDVEQNHRAGRHREALPGQVPDGEAPEERHAARTDGAGRPPAPNPPDVVHQSGVSLVNPVDLPLPVVRRPQAPTDVGALERDLRERVDGEVRFDAGTRATYSTDGSNYRQVPIAVVLPRTVEAAVEAVAACRGWCNSSAPRVKRPTPKPRH